MGAAELTAPKRFQGTTHRVCSPRDTLARIQPLAGSAGVTRVADITGLDRIGIPVTLAIRPNARSLVGSSGKGTSLLNATVSGLMEAIEIHHAENPSLAVERHTHRSLESAGVPVAPAARLPLSRLSTFTVDVELPWTWGWDIARGVATAVPYQTVHLAGPRASAGPGVLRDSMFQVSSNGLASGNHPLEAIAAGLYEVVERDAVTLDRIRESSGEPPDLIDLDAVPWAAVAELVAQIRAAGADVLVGDITSDIGIPTYRATLLDRQRNVGAYGGFGTHLDPAVAMVRAITEAVQSRCVIIAGSRDDLFTAEHERNRRLDDAARYDERRRHEATARPPERESAATDSFEGDIALVLARLDAAGLDQAIVVDLGLADFGLDVVRVIVPGLEGHAKFSFWTPGERGRRALAAAR